MIKEVSPSAAGTSADLRIIEGDGHTLIPGLSDAHAHISVVANPHDIFDKFQWAYTGALMVVEAEKMLLRGFTTIRDA